MLNSSIYFCDNEASYPSVLFLFPTKFSKSPQLVDIAIELINNENSPCQIFISFHTIMILRTNSILFTHNNSSTIARMIQNLDKYYFRSGWELVFTRQHVTNTPKVSLKPSQHRLFVPWKVR